MKRLQYVICIICSGRDIHYKAIRHFCFSCTKFTTLVLTSRQISLWSSHCFCAAPFIACCLLRKKIFVSSLFPCNW